MNRLTIGVIAPSSKVPRAELEIGVEKLESEGFNVRVHPQALREHLFFAGNDEDRANAFFEYAKNPEIDVLWFARGGYGSVRVLPLLERMAREKGIPPRKLLVGFSDATAVLEYTRVQWGWKALHANMISGRRFSILKKAEWQSTLAFVRGQTIAEPWGKKKLKWIGEKPSDVIEAPLVGGNLCVWNSLVGTPFQGNAEGKIVFFEEVDEAFYRIDRMLQQLELSGGLKGVRAIVLGDFLNCHDTVPPVLAKRPKPKDLARVLDQPKPKELAPLRKKIEDAVGLRAMFLDLHKKTGIPIALGLPSGHGPGHSPVPLGAQAALTPSGSLQIKSWS